MRLVHFSDRIITELKPHEELLRGFNPEVPEKEFKKWLESRRYRKPSGLWLSDEDEYGWKKWCEAEDFRLYKLKYEHSVTLKPGAKILYLRTAKDIDDFADKYIYKESKVHKVLEKIDRQFPNIPADIMEIDWPRVEKEYQGIVITPYIWSQRLGRHMWYYSWDCASGCVWDNSAIESIKHTKTHKVSTKADDDKKTAAMMKSLKSKKNKVGKLKT